MPRAGRPASRAGRARSRSSRRRRRPRSRARGAWRIRGTHCAGPRGGVPRTVSDISDDEQLETCRELRARGELTLRIHFRYPLERWSELAARGVRAGSDDEWIRLGCLEGHIDGILGSSTARFFEPYAHEPEKRARDRDEANHVLLYYLEQLVERNGARERLRERARNHAPRTARGNSGRARGPYPCHGRRRRSSRIVRAGRHWFR